MKTEFSDELRETIELHLETILESDKFHNAPTVRAFLDYVVRETLAGRGDQLKAYTIAVEAFGRNASFDPSSDTIVRTTAGRVRQALKAYYRALDHKPELEIILPKGGYVPSFQKRATSALPERAVSGSIPSKKLSMRNVACVCITRKRAGALLAAIAVGLALFLGHDWIANRGFDEVLIDVRPVEDVSEQAHSLARQFDTRLAPALSRLRIAEVIEPGASRENARTRMWSLASPDTFSFTLSVSIISSEPGYELVWKLSDNTTNLIVRSAQLQLASADAKSVDLIVDRIAFEVLGVSGAVSSVLEKSYPNLYVKPTCYYRARTLEMVQDDRIYAKTKDCLERIIAVAPGDASAWAILSTAYTYRSHFRTAGTFEERSQMVAKAERAAEKAVELSPTSYLTKVALMNLALRQRRFDEFDKLQRELRAKYPGDVFLQIRIATRIARLGRGHGQEALQIFNQAEKEFGVNLKNWAPGIAVAYFSEGDYGRAYQEMLRATSDLPFVAVLKASLLGKLDRIDEAAAIIRELVQINPDLAHTYYQWLTDAGWAPSLVLDIADGLAKGGMVVEIPEPVPSKADPV